MRGSTNMKDADERGGGVLVPEDTYLVEITKVIDRQSKGGDDMPSIKLTILSGEYMNSPIWDRILFKEGGILGRAKHFLHVIGEPYNDDPVNWDSDNWYNKKLRVKVSQEEYPANSGKLKNTVLEHLFESEEDQQKYEDGEPVDDFPF